MLNDFPKFGELLSIGDIVFRLSVAVFFGAVIGIDRETKNRPVGMRTHVLVVLKFLQYNKRNAPIIF